MCARSASHGTGSSTAALRHVTLGMEIREAMVKHIGERRTKALSSRSELDSHRFRSSLFNIFFEPRLSEFQGKLYMTFQAMSVERLSHAALPPTCPRSAAILSSVSLGDLLYVT